MTLYCVRFVIFFLLFIFNSCGRTLVYFHPDPHRISAILILSFTPLTDTSPRIVLLTTMVIYILVGRVVFENQARFRELSENASKNQANMAATSIPNPIVLTVGPDSKTTEVNITSDSCASRANRTECKRASCTIKVTSTTAPIAPKKVKVKKERSSADRAAWSYLKCALLFFTAMVVVWVCIPPFLAVCFLRKLLPPPYPTLHNHSTASHLSSHYPYFSPFIPAY